MLREPGSGQGIVHEYDGVAGDDTGTGATVATLRLHECVNFGNI